MATKIQGTGEKHARAAIVLAQHHMAGKPQACALVEDACATFTRGDYTTALAFAQRSLASSVGMQHPDFLQVAA